MLNTQAFLSNGSQIQSAVAGDPIVACVHGVYASLEEATAAAKEMTESANENGENTADLPFLLMDLGPYHALSLDPSYSQEVLEVGERMEDAIARKMAPDPNEKPPKEDATTSKSKWEENLLPSKHKKSRTEKQVDEERNRIDRLLNVEGEGATDALTRELAEDWENASTDEEAIEALARIIDRYALAREKVGMARYKRDEAVPRREGAERAATSWRDRVQSALLDHPEWNYEWVERYVDALASSGIVLSEADPNSIVPFLYEPQWGEERVDIEGLVRERMLAVR
jgi:hypothetical protein